MTATEQSPASSGAVAARHALVVLGMHRSGTSAVSGVLARLGADLPARLMVPTPDNPKGYFESNPVRLLNDRILASAGTTWDDWTRIPDGWFAGPRAAAFRAEASDVLAAEFGQSPLFVLKDPRICRLWPFWKSLLAAEGIATHPIMILRNPLEVAESLSRRDGTAPALGLLIWLRHQLDAEHATRGQPRVITTYDELLTDWRGTITRIEAVAGFSMPRRSPISETEIADFLSTDLRHSRHDAASLAQQSNLPGFLEPAFRLLARLAEDDTAGDITGALDGISTDLNGLLPTLHQIGVQSQTHQRDAARLLRERDTLTGQVRQLTTERDKLTGQVRQLTTERDTLTGQVRQLTTERDKLTGQVGQLTAERDKLVGRIRELTPERDALRAELADRTRELGKMTRLTAEREALFAEKAKADLKAQEIRLLTEIHASTSWKVTAPLRGARHMLQWLLRPLRGKCATR